MGKILVVDDNLFELSGLCRMLERLGFSVRAATDGAEALEHIHRETFDLLLTDVWMPRMTGLELLRRLPNDHPPKVIVMTADEETEAVLRRLGRDYIMKPFASQRLIEAIERTIGRAIGPAVIPGDAAD